MSKKRVEKALQKKFELLVFRQEKFTPTNFTIITATVNGDAIPTEKALIEAVRAGVEKWVRETEDGKIAYAHAEDDMNIGDLMNYELEPLIERCPDIYELEIKSIDANEAQHWNFDTRLCPRIPELDT